MKNRKQPEVKLEPERFGVIKESEAGQQTICFTRHLDHPVEKVWRAIAIAEHRQAWFPELHIDLQIGGVAILDFSGGDCPAPEDNPGDVYQCKIIAYEPPHLLEYIGAGEHHRFELTETRNNQCKLVFNAYVPPMSDASEEHTIIIPRYSVACGWHYKLDEMEWSLDGISFEDEGFAGPGKTKLYLEYLRREQGDTES